MGKLVGYLKERRIFKQNKQSLRTKAKAFLLYQNGLSYKEIADQIGLGIGKSPSKSRAYRWVKRVGGFGVLELCRIPILS